MTLRISLAICALVFLTASIVPAQRPEVTISLNEAFFDSLLDAVFQNSSPFEFPIAANAHESRPDVAQRSGEIRFDRAAYSVKPDPEAGSACNEVIRILRETNDGVRTSVRFRDGRILVPMAFTGNYNPPLIGCVPFSGVAETIIDLEFDAPNQRLIARARVLNVNLNGTGGVGGTLIAKMVQGSIDRKINPIEIITMDKISFLLPVRTDVNVRMKAVSVRHEILNGALNVIIAYDFVKV